MAYLTRDQIYAIKRENDLELMKYYSETNKENFFIRLEYAKMLSYNGMYSEAKAELKTLLGTRYEMSARYEFGKIALAQKNFDLAREHFEYVEQNTTYPSERDKTRYELGRLEFETKNYSESEFYFKELLGTSFDESARLSLGKVYCEQGKYEESKKTLKTLLDTKYSLPATYELGKVEYILGNTSAARHYYKSAIGEGYSKAIYKLGELEYNENNFKDAEFYFKNCKYAGLYLPKTKYMLGKKDEAINEFKSLLNTKDGFYSALFLSIIYIKDGKNEEAFDIINKYMASYNSIDDGVKLRIALILYKELGVFFYKEYPRINDLSYSDKQTVKYDENRTLSHISNNHINIEGKNEFSEGINLYELLTEVKEKLTEENKTPTLNLNDMYHLNYPGIGKDGESLLRVITIAGTKDILTMFPVFSSRDEVNESEEEFDYDTRVDMLLNKIATLYQLSKTNDFEFGDALSDSEKELLSEVFDIKTRRLSL